MIATPDLLPHGRARFHAQTIRRDSYAIPRRRRHLRRVRRHRRASTWHTTWRGACPR